MDELERPVVEAAVAELGGPAAHLEEEAAAIRIMLDVHPGQASLEHRRWDSGGPASTDGGPEAHPSVHFAGACVAAAAALIGAGAVGCGTRFSTAGIVRR